MGKTQEAHHCQVLVYEQVKGSSMHYEHEEYF
jgi:hypothetical protein